MNTGRTIRKIFFALLWISIGAGMVTLFAAAIGKQKKERCEGYVINIISNDGHLFVDKTDVEKIIAKANGGSIRGVLVSSFDLNDLESALRKSEWIQGAELYFDNQDVLHANIRERVPVARIFTNSGQSFYIDEDLQRLPLSKERTVKLPSFTGFADKKKFSAKDSLVFRDVVAIAQFIRKDPFWSVQAAQIDHGTDGFDIIPVLGNHVIKIGDAVDIEKKFRRLKIFYSNVIAHTGLDRYKLIDVRFEGQVIGMKNAFTSKLDSIQFRKNIEKLMHQSRELVPVQLPEAKADDQPKAVPVVTQQELMNKPVEDLSNDTVRTPKAVMPKREQ